MTTSTVLYIDRLFDFRKAAFDGSLARLKEEFSPEKYIDAEDYYNPKLREYERQRSLVLKDLETLESYRDDFMLHDW